MKIYFESEYFLFLVKKDDDTLRNIVEQEYATLYRQQHKAAQNKAR